MPSWKLSSSVLSHTFEVLEMSAATPFCFSLAVATFLSLSWTCPSSAQQHANLRIEAPPSRALLKRAPIGTNILSSEPTLSGFSLGTGPGEAFLDLVIGYTDSTVYNPATGQNDKVRLRSYRDANSTAPAAIPFVAPTVDVLPGDTVRITLTNTLPNVDPSCAATSGPVNEPHCFNSTNLHAHGLWVSPSGNSDNVMLRLKPGVSFQYEYNIPLDHPAGTYWYHPHLHGSTAIQVSSGMAGVLIVRGTRLPVMDRNGDIDTLLYNADGSPFRDRIVLLQQIQYACRDANGAIKTGAGGRYICDAGDTGGIEGYDQFGPGTWKQSGRHTSINGQVRPVFTEAVAGRIERWRLVHAGVRDTIKLQFRKLRPGASEQPSGEDASSWIEQNCLPSPLEQFTIASDGLTRSAVAEQTTSVLQPGYRTDILIAFPEAGTYCAIDDEAPAAANVNAEGKGRKLIATVEVGVGNTVTGAIRDYVAAQLIAAASRTMPTPVRASVVADLQNMLSLSRFTPHLLIADSELSGKQSLEFGIVLGQNTAFQIDGKSYAPDRIDRLLPLGGVEEWTLTSLLAGHPFHIHVNPFQIVSIFDRTGADVSADGEVNDPQYAALKGQWKDTIFVKQGYKVVVRTRYQRYIGDFVLHCHILDHEDQGMMQNVRIGVPDGAGGVAGGHH